MPCEGAAGSGHCLSTVGPWAARSPCKQCPQQYRSLKGPLIAWLKSESNCANCALVRFYCPWISQGGRDGSTFLIRESQTCLQSADGGFCPGLGGRPSWSCISEVKMTLVQEKAGFPLGVAFRVAPQGPHRDSEGTLQAPEPHYRGKS